jgi:anti-sigma factor RsiW
MTGPGCAATRDAAPELALGTLDGADRAEVLLHVATCAPCQRYVSELAGVADGLARLAPEAEPPAGFSVRVDAAIRGTRRRTRRRWMATVAVTAAAAAILAVTVVRVVDASRSTHAVAAPALRSAVMVGANGIRVGHVTVSGTTPAGVAVSVDYSVPDGSYALQLREAGGVVRSIGSITIAGGHGQWTGTTGLPPHSDATVALVASNGTIVCRAAVRGAAI